MTHAPSRIQSRFDRLKQEGRAGFVAFLTAGDPDDQTSLALLKGLSDKGVDVIELGMPFSDPMADGASIQRASLRALSGGQTLAKTLDLVAEFRQYDKTTPIVLMGYFNPIYQFGTELFVERCCSVGVDGLIVVDLPSEADNELCIPARKAGLDFIRLITPTTDAARLKRILEHSSGFLYYVSITGITGTVAPRQEAVSKAVEAIRQATDLPIAIGFGLRTPDQARDMARVGDAVVVGSALVDEIGQGLNAGQDKTEIVRQTLTKVSALVKATRSARETA